MIYLVIPCYNERNRLDLNAFMNFQMASLIVQPVRFLFVDDGSKDGTYDWILDFKKDIINKNQKLNDLDFQVIKLEKNSGKAEAVRSGILFLGQQEKLSPLDWVGFWDADLATPLK